MIANNAQPVIMAPAKVNFSVKMCLCYMVKLKVLLNLIVKDYLIFVCSKNAV